MNRKDEKDNQNLIEFWNKAYELSEENKRQISGNGSDGWRSMAPSEKLFLAASFHASVYEAKVDLMKVSTSWLEGVPSRTYDGLICSNVLDVVPQETSQDLIHQFARVTKVGAKVIIGLNFFMSAERAAERGMDLVDGRKLYVDGVLRLVSLSDDEWTALFSRHFKVIRLEHFAWPGEKSETRRLFHLQR